MWEAIFGLVGVVVGSGLVLLYNYYRDRREREEKYRVMLYEKRLEVHQKAFYYVQKLLDPLNDYLNGYGYPNDEKLAAIYREAKEFHHLNSLYLDEGSRTDMMRAIYSIEFYFEGDEEIKDAFDQLRKAREAIMSGIGMKHIEKLKKPQPEGKS